MEIRIRNVRTIKSADIRVDGITLLAGNNGSGKTSILAAVAACLAGEYALPTFDIRTKKDGEALVWAQGDERASGAIVRVGDDGNNYCAVQWPSGEVEMKGKAPTANPYATGHLNLMTADVKERGKMLAVALDAEPTKDDVIEALKAVGFKKDATHEKVWKLIEDNGWAAAHRTARDRGVKMKGKWEQITGEKFGSVKADGWRPRDIDETDIVPIEKAEKKLAGARSRLEEAIATAAISQERRAELAAKVGLLPEIRKDIAEAEGAIDRIQAEVNKIAADVAAMPNTSDQAAIRCPHCNEQVIPVMRGGVLSGLEKRPGKIPADELKDLRLQRAELDGSLRRLESEGTAENRKIAALRVRLDDAEAAKQVLDDAVGKQDGTPDGVAKARGVVEHWERIAGAIKRMEEAASAAAQIQQNQKVIDVLDPGGGVRLAKLKKSLDDFNSIIARLAAGARLPEMEISTDMQGYMGGRAYPLLSESEKLRFDIVLRVALAKKGLSQMVCLDRFDAIQPQDRPAILKMLSATGIPALVGMMAKDPGAVPNLEKAKLKDARTYWLHNHGAERLADVVGQQQAAE